eukprot:CAMPEP_0198330800 /NCGR_PEP_ID=MMETSP1450-20131203/17174_1 /TAXON_ID=753684 ORGANISM="Madagascaria erythrocladiodes, Strain CCMP3234" /NCGR_SAMPLE_ID=MMETSP1450 /ASSEMBLY_ACC=CAM_ASM_001115 /LENGTH=87 /DNA_ID=CAMNT_0044035127 /DNA_START=57 /DNA_END=320 /DNA_ORIENTATION=-
MVANRLGLELDGRRRDGTNWGPFAVEVAHEILQLSLDEGVVRRGMLCMVNLKTRKHPERADLAAFVEQNGGVEHTARRLGLLPHFFS